MLLQDTISQVIIMNTNVDTLSVVIYLKEAR